MSQYRMVSDLRMDSPALEHKFKYQARLLDERTARLQPELRSSSKVGGGKGGGSSKCWEGASKILLGHQQGSSPTPLRASKGEGRCVQLQLT